MPMSSSEISMLVGQNQMMMTNQMQHAAMISQQAGTQPFGEQVMGRGMNIGAGIGAPVIQGAMSLAGLDPMSMAFRGGMAGFGMGGIAGAAGGAVMGAGIGVPIMAAQYGAQQMLQGAQQQQQLNAMLRQSYGFMGAHGRGFTGGEMGGIGQMLRQQSMIQGPAGEFAGFGELTQLASRMSQMGMGGQNVRNAFEFNEKFKQMLSQVKEIAVAFNTSLEQAQQVMGSMRGAGIFRNQGQIAQQIRDISMAGGMATSEITGMMTVGSQLSRMIGGRGRAGAMGGMRTIQNIGMAQQMGLLSDEQLYELTGLEGAEGRRALATQRMQQAAQFLRGGLGRRMIASMAGPEGTLDEGSVSQWQAGGVGTDQTMAMAGRNLGRVGQANFIRNEGRLRGEVLGRFGGLAPIAAMASWLEQRGMNPADDRGLIFMSRRLGMSTEEAEQQLKEYRNLERMEAFKEDRSFDQRMWQDVEKFRGSRGIAGVKKKFEAARNQVQNTLRQYGADFFQAGSEMVEEWVNRVTGDFHVAVSRDVGEAIRDARSGYGGYARSVAERRFGFGRGAIAQELGRAGLREIGAGGGVTTEQIFAERGARRFQEAGWNVSGMGDLNRVRGIQTAGREGTAEGKWSDQGTLMRDKLRNAAAFGGITGTGEQFLANFGRTLERSGASEQLRRAYAEADTEGKARIARDVMGGAGLGGVMNRMMSTPDEELVGAGRWRSEGEGVRAMARLMEGIQDTGFEARIARRREQVRAVAGLAAFTAGGAMGALTERIAGGRDLARAAGEGAYGAGATGESLSFADRAANTYEELARGLSPERTGDVAARGAERLTKTMAAGAGVWGVAFTALRGHERVGAAVRGGVGSELGWMSQGTREQAVRYLATEKGAEAARNVLSREPATRRAAIEEAQRRSLELSEAAGGDVGKMNELERGEYEAQRSLLASGRMADLIEESEKTGVPISEEQVRALATELGGEGYDPKNVEQMLKAVSAQVQKSQGADRAELYRRAGIAGREESERYQRLGMVRGGRLTAAGMGAGGKMTTLAMPEAGKAPGTKAEDAEAEARRRIAKMAGLGAQGGDITTGNLYSAAMAVAASAEEQLTPADTEGNMRNAMVAEAARRIGKDQGLAQQSPQELLKEAQRRRAIGDMEGGAMYERQAKNAGRLGALKGKGGAMIGLVTSQMLGLDFNKREIAGMQGMDPEQLAGVLAERAGLKDEAARGQLAAALTAAKEGKGGEAALGIAGIGGKVAEAQREQQYERAKKDDPTVRAITDLKGAVVDALTGDLKAQITNPEAIAKAASPEGQPPPPPPGSDRRLKENIKPIEGALDKIACLSGNNFDWKSSGERDVGVIAQEVQEVLPEAVRDRGDGYLTVDYYKLIPLMLEALKELRAQVEIQGKAG